MSFRILLKGGQMYSAKILGGYVVCTVYTVYILQGGASQFSRGGGQINPPAPLK